MNTIQQSWIPYTTKLDGGMQQSLPNSIIDNIDYNIDYNKGDNKEISSEILPTPFELEFLEMKKMCEELQRALEEEKKKKEERKSSGKKKEGFIPPTIEEVEDYFLENGYRRDAGTKAFNYYSIAGWKDSKGSQVKNWKQKVLSVWFKDENKLPIKNGESRQESRYRNIIV